MGRKWGGTRRAEHGIFRGRVGPERRYWAVVSLGCVAACLVAIAPSAFKPLVDVLASSPPPSVVNLNPQYLTPQPLAHDATAPDQAPPWAGDTTTNFKAPAPIADGTTASSVANPASVSAQSATNAALVSWPCTPSAPNDPVVGYIVRANGTNLHPHFQETGYSPACSAASASAQMWMTGLAPGTYVFSVVARTADLIGSSASAPVTPLTTINSDPTTPDVPTPAQVESYVVAAATACGATTPPGAPQSLAATADNQTISATWSAPSCGGGTAISGYTATLFISGGPSNGSQVGSPVNTPSTTTSATFTGVPNGTSYYVDVYATNSFGPGPGANSNTVTPMGPPTVKVTVASGRTALSRGEVLQVSVQVTNPYPTSMANTTTTAQLWSDAVGPQQSWITVDGAPCSSTECQISGGTLTFSTSIPASSSSASSSHTFTYSVVYVGSDRGCSYGTTTATAVLQGYSGSNSSSASTEICDGGEGRQPWWTFDSRSVGPQSSAAVNVANGNLLLTANDSTPIKGRGSLVFSLQRAYNSADIEVGAAPYRLGHGWILTPSPAAVAGLFVPSSEITYGFPVTLIGSSGQRSVIPLAALPSAISVATTTGAESTIQPRVLRGTNVDQGYQVCVDMVGQPIPGVHIGIWRYVEEPTGTTCSVGGITSKLLGFGAELPDRTRYEFASDGHLVDLADAAGNEMKLNYANLPTAGATLGNPTTFVELSTGRQITFSYPSSTETDVADPAGRRTKYFFNSSLQLTQVVNPDSSTVEYAYGSACSGSGAWIWQLCSVTDPRSNTTTFFYTGTFSQGYNNTGASIPGPGYVSGVMNRDGVTSTYFWQGNRAFTFEVVGTEQTRYIFDSFASVFRKDQDLIDAAHNVTQVLQMTYAAWDTDPFIGGLCRQPDAVVDHNLCKTFQFAEDGSAAAVDTLYSYGPLGQMLSKTSCLNATDNDAWTKWDANPPSCPGAQAITTTGFSSEYVNAATTQVYADSAAGSGNVTSQAGSNGSRWDAQTLFVVIDQTQAVTPRGNAPGSDYTAYLTKSYVDNNSSVALNTGPTGSTCSSVTSPPATNTGLVCGTDAPAFDGVHPTSTRSTYNSNGELVTEETPKALAETPSGTAIPAVQYTYYKNTDNDLSGTRVAGGWLKAVTDPLGNMTVYAYDAAGDRVRTWDGDATHGFSVDQFPGGLDGTPAQGGPPSCAYSETLYATDPAKPPPSSWGPCPAQYTVSRTIFASPWRYPVAQRDAIGNLVTETVDFNGNVTTSRPGRGNPTSGAVSSYDTTMQYAPSDRLLSVQTPVEAAAGDPPTTYGYDAYGNKTSVTDPLGNVKVYVYDAANREIATEWTRGPWPSDTSTVPSACTESSGNSPIPDGRILCTTAQGWNGADEQIATSDGNHQTSTFTFDGLHHQLTATVPRNDGTYTTLETVRVYDVAGNLIATCPPRHFTEGGGSACSASSPTPFDKVSTYNALDKVVTTTTYENNSSTPRAQVTTFGCDADGNVTTATDAEGHQTTYLFDLADRRMRVTTPRSPGVSVATTTAYDPAGHTITVTTADGAQSFVTAYSYDADGRLVDTVKGASNGTSESTSPDGGQNVRTRVVYDADANPIITYPPNSFPPNVISSSNTTFTSTSAMDNSTTWPNNGWIGSTVIAGGSRATVTGGGYSNSVQVDAWSGGTPPAGTVFTIIPHQPNEAYMRLSIYDADDRLVRTISPRTTNVYGHSWICTEHYASCPLEDGAGPEGMGSSCPWNPATLQPAGTAYPRSPAGYPAYPDSVELCYADRQYDADGRQVGFIDADGRQWNTQYSDDGLKSATLGFPATASPGSSFIRGGPYPYTFGPNSVARNYDNFASTTAPAHGDSIRVTWANDCSGPIQTEAATVDSMSQQGTIYLTANWASEPSNSYCYASFEVSHPSMVTTMAYFYDGNGKQVKTTDAVGRNSVSQYTSEELLSSRTDEPNGSITHVQRWTYDGNGNQVTAQDPMQNTTTNAYYSDNRLKTVQAPGDAAGTMDITSYGYDRVGNVTSMTSPSGSARDATNRNGLATGMSYTYDNRLQSEMRPLAADGSAWRTMTYQYDAVGLKSLADTRVTDSNGNTLSNQDAEAETYAYYPDERLRLETGRDGRSTHQYAYDASGNATSIANLDATGATLASVTSSNYFDNSLSTSTSSVAGGSPVRSEYLYTGSGLTESRPEGWTTYNDAGLRASSSTSSNSSVYETSNFTYAASGELVDVRNATPVSSGSTTVLSDQTYTRNPDGTLASTTVTNGGSTTDAAWTYTYDNNKRIASWSFSGTNCFGNSTGPGCTSSAQPVTASGSDQYYPSGRLRTAATTGPASGGGPATVTNTATWDHDGNRLTWGSSAYQYNPDGSIASGAGPYKYNAAGDLSQDDCGTYQYNAFDQQSGATIVSSSNAGCPATAGQAAYVYDALGRMVESTFNPTTGTQNQSIITYNGLGRVQASEQQFSGSTQGNTIQYMSDGGGNLRAVATSAPGTSTVVEAANDDGHGSITTMVQQGATSCNAFFGAFGANEFSAGGLAPCSTGYSFNSEWYRGGRLDRNVGTYQFGARTYSPSTGTWSQPDAYAASGSDLSLTLDPATRNPYSYVDGDPVNFADPTGHSFGDGLGMPCEYNGTCVPTSSSPPPPPPPPTPPPPTPTPMPPPAPTPDPTPPPPTSGGSGGSASGSVGDGGGSQGTGQPPPKPTPQPGPPPICNPCLPPAPSPSSDQGGEGRMVPGSASTISEGTEGYVNFTLNSFGVYHVKLQAYDPNDIIIVASGAVETLGVLGTGSSYFLDEGNGTNVLNVTGIAGAGTYVLGGVVAGAYVSVRGPGLIILTGTLATP
jgi:RHS repeat-associated protein